MFSTNRFEKIIPIKTNKDNIKIFFIYLSDFNIKNNSNGKTI